MKMLVGTKNDVKAAPVRAVPVGRRERLPLIEVPDAYIIDRINREERERQERKRPRIWVPSPDDYHPRRRNEERERDSDGNTVVVPLHDEEPKEDDAIVIRLK